MDEPVIEASAGGAPPAGTEDSPRRPVVRRPLLIALGLAVLLLVPGLWVRSARDAAVDFDAAVGGAGPPCDPPAEGWRLDGIYEAMDVPDELEDVRAAFIAFHAQEAWQYIDEDPAQVTIRHTADGDLLRRQDGDGFIGLVGPSSSVAQFEGDSFWVPTCLNTPSVLSFAAPDLTCVDADRRGDDIVHSWAVLGDGGTCESPSLAFTTTLRNGALHEWTMAIRGGPTTTSRVEEPESLSWPPLWRIVPRWLISDF